MTIDQRMFHTENYQAINKHKQTEKVIDVIIHRVPKNQAPKTLDGINFVKS